MVILENIDINIDIDKAILQNIDIDKIANRFKFGISNRARLGSDKNGGDRLDFFLLFNTLVLSFCRLSQGVRVKPIMVIPRFRKRPLYKVLPCRSKQWKWQNRRHWLPTRGANSPLARSRRSTCGTLWRLVFNHYDDIFFKILKVGLQSMHDSFQYLQKQLNSKILTKLQLQNLAFDFKVLTKVLKVWTKVKLYDQTSASKSATSCC